MSVPRAAGIQRALDALSNDFFRLTATEAHRLGCCIRCRRDVSPDDLSALDRNEYRLSGFCPDCYRDILPPEDCE